MLSAPSYNAEAYIVAKRESNGGGDATAAVTEGVVAKAGLMTLTVPAVGLVTMMVAAPILERGETIGGTKKGDI